MTATTEQISRLLRESGEIHHRVFRIAAGADDDWASWYADWLVNLSVLPSLLGTKPVRSELTYLLVSLDKDYTASQPSQTESGSHDGSRKAASNRSSWGNRRDGTLAQR
jgi:hypothetical protein